MLIATDFAVFPAFCAPGSTPLNRGGELKICRTAERDVAGAVGQLVAPESRAGTPAPDLAARVVSDRDGLQLLQGS